MRPSCTKHDGRRSLHGAIKETINGTRKTQIETRVHPPFRRLRDRHRKCVEVPLHGRSGRRRRVRAVLSALPRHSGPAHHEHGVCRGPRQPQKPGARLSGPREARPEVAHPRLLHPHRLLSADDVLHHGGGLDAPLLLHDRRRKALRSGCRSGGRCLHRDAGKPAHHGLLDGGGRGVRHLCLRPRPAERPREGDEGDDDRPSGHHGGAGRQQPVYARRKGGPALLSCARLWPHEGGGRRQHAGGGHESGLLHPEPRRRRNGHLRQLHRQGARPAGGERPCRGAGHLRGSDLRPHHLPGLLHLRRGPDQRPQPHLHHPAQHLRQYVDGPSVGQPVLPVYGFCGPFHRSGRL